MRTRIIRKFDTTKCQDVFCVQKWMLKSDINRRWAREFSGRGAERLGLKIPTYDGIGEWDSVKYFDLDEYDKAAAYAMDLSMTKKSVDELAIFEDGQPTEIAKSQAEA